MDDLEELEECLDPWNGIHEKLLLGADRIVVCAQWEYGVDVVNIQWRICLACFPVPLRATGEGHRRLSSSLGPGTAPRNASIYNKVRCVGEYRDAIVQLGNNDIVVNKARG